MNKISKLALSIIAATSANTFAFEVTDGLEIGVYGESGISIYDEKEIDVIQSNSNAFIGYTFENNINVMLDYTYQYQEQSVENIKNDYSNGDIYQAYIAYEGLDFAFKAGRFADFYSKGSNSMNTMGSMVHVDISPFLILGQAKNSVIDGLSLDYKYPLDHGGQMRATVYGGTQTEKYSDEIENGTEATIESMKYGLHADIQKQGHTFIFGMEFSDIDTIETDEVKKVADDLTKYKSVYLTYQFENDFIFSDNTYLLNEIETKDGDFLQSVFDLKLGTTYKGFKPFVGYNVFEDENDKYETISYGVRYDYKEKIGFIVKRDSVDKLEGSALSDQRWTASVIYDF